jgi:hypothetical protein
MKFLTRDDKEIGAAVQRVRLIAADAAEGVG